jgi:serine/threonine protein kinase
MHLRTQAAIKAHHVHVEKTELERFEQEARTLAHLSHPHIVRVLDYGVQGTVPYLVMEYAPHGTLRDLHPVGTIVPLETVVRYVKQIAAALQYAHDHKLVHRDVKPENMLLDVQDRVLLSDFGIAIRAHTSGTLTATGCSVNATYLVIGDAKGNISLFSATNCSCWTYTTSLHAHNGQINAISWAPDNKTFATAGDDGTIQSWKTIQTGQTGSTINEGIQHQQTYTRSNHRNVLSVAWSPDGKYLLFEDDAGTVNIWQA